MLHKSSGKMPRQARQASFAGEDCEKISKRNDLVESGPVLVLTHLTGAVLARYNPDQDVYSPGKPAIYNRPDKYGPWNELYRARHALVSFGIAALQYHLASRRGKVVLRHFVCL